MKVEITYEFVRGNRFPFSASAYIDGKIFEVGSSNKSFDEAKEDVLEKTKRALEIVPTIIPDPEEVEI